MLFILLAPITVPAYLLFIAAGNLLGAAYYIVVEASLSRILSRPISLTRGQMWLFAIPVLIAAPFAAGAHFLFALVRGTGRILSALGHWQSGVTSRSLSLAFGLVWVLAALWTTMVCFNAAMGMSWIGQGISEPTLHKFVDAYRLSHTLGDLPPDMLARRAKVIHELKLHKVKLSDYWEGIKDALEDDNCPFDRLPTRILTRKIGGIPWYYYPKDFSEDGLDHSRMLLGPLLFCWMLLIRWPGMFSVLRPAPLRIAAFLVRTVGVVIAIYSLATWVPLAVEDTLWPNITQLTIPGLMASPAAWFGEDFSAKPQPVWYLYNAGLWMILLGLTTFIWWSAWRVSPFLGWPKYYVAFLASRLLQRKRIAFFSVGAVTLCVAMMIIVISVMGGFVDSIRDRANGLLGDLVVDGSLQGFPFYEEFIAELKKMKDAKTGEPLVEEATPLIFTYGILQFPQTRYTKAVSIRGIKLDEFVKVNEFGKDLYYNNRYGDTRLDIARGQPLQGYDENGRAVLPGDMDRHYRETWLPSLSPEKRAEEERLYPRDGSRFLGPGVFYQATEDNLKPAFAGEEYPGMIIGRDIIMKRLPSGEYDRPWEYPRGELCLLTIIPMSRSGKIIQQAPPQPAFRYVDDSKTGIHEIDSTNVYVDFDRLQKLLDMGPQKREEGDGFTSPRCNQIQIKINPKFAWPRETLLEKKRQVEQLWRNLRATIEMDPLESQMVYRTGISTWEEMQADFIAAIEKEKFLVLIMFGVISIVAVLLILCIFYMIVQEKTRDIGIIKSVGASTEGVIAVFLVYGAAIGFVGAILGSLLGTTFIEHINEVQDWLARINPAWRVWSPATYSFDKIPSAWKWNEVIGIGLLAIVSSILGAAFPAMRAGKTWPVEALRYE